MYRIMLVGAILLLRFFSYSAYQVGEVCENISWTDNSGLETSIYEQIDEGKAVMLFFGQYG